MRNIRLVIAYDGTGFHGWQRQPQEPTVQALLEARIEQITGKPVTLYGSGRTDAGVHAAGQVANFRTACPIPCKGLMTALNNLLPPVVRICKAREVHPEFHSRLHARSKIYRYRILQARVCPPFLARFVHHYPYALNFSRMAKAARLFEGEHDFTSFAGIDSGKQSAGGSERKRSNIRRIYSSCLRRHKDLSLLVYEVQGSGFLNHMVRNMVGTLIDVGRDKLLPDAITAILAAQDRRRAGATAPPHGLCLVRVEYDMPDNTSAGRGVHQSNSRNTTAGKRGGGRAKLFSNSADCKLGNDFQFRNFNLHKSYKV